MEADTLMKQVKEHWKAVIFYKEIFLEIVINTCEE